MLSERTNVAMRVLILAGIVVVCCPCQRAAAADAGIDDRRPRDRGFDAYHAPILRIGPVDGITEGWHVAPPVTGVPAGSLLTFAVNVPVDASVRWTGAVETARDDAR